MESVDFVLGGLPEVLGPWWRGHLIEWPRPKEANYELFEKTPLEPMRTNEVGSKNDTKLGVMAMDKLGFSD